MALSLQESGRFRVNVFKQRGEVGMVIRAIRSTIPSIEELQLPQVLKEIIMAPRGLVLIVGSTGSGKLTTLASMIDFRNTSTSGHILTIEDPIEYRHRHKKSIVNQREVGLDTHAFHNALKNAMRERSEEHTSELQSLMRSSYAVFCLKKKKKKKQTKPSRQTHT